MTKKILSTADLARLFGVTETTIKRWSNDGSLQCLKTPGGHRKYQIEDVLAFAEEHGMRPIGALDAFENDPQLPFLQSAVLTRDYPRLSGQLTERLLHPQDGGISEFLIYLFQHGLPLPAIYDEVISPAMRRIGNKWAEGEIEITDEHAASHRLFDALAALQAHVPSKKRSGKKALFASLDEELHEIGLRCAANVFASEGWEVRYIGSRTPLDALERLIRRSRPDILCISSTAPVDPDRLLHALGILRNTMRELGGELLVGGVAFTDTGFAREFGGATFRSVGEISQWLRSAATERRNETTGTSIP